MEEKKRYNLGVLIGGVHTYFPKEHIKVISFADQQLYEAKKHRKKSVSRMNNEGA